MSRLAGALLAACLVGTAAVPRALAAQDGAASAVRFTRILSGDAVEDAYSSPSASWIDIDGDGDEDLYVLSGFGSLEDPPVPQRSALYRNDGGMRFTSLPEHPLVRDVAFSGSSTWADYDNDGDLDVFVANQQNADNFLYRNDDGAFTRVREGPAVNDGGRSFSAVWVDMDGDGWVDLHVFNGRSTPEGQPDRVYRNEGGGVLTPMEDLPFATVSLPSGGGAWGDFDGDGDPDLYLPVNANGEPGRLYRNEGDWRFREVGEEVGLSHEPLPATPRSSVAEWVDYDNDGDLDLFVGNSSGIIDFLYRNDGRGGLERVTAGRVGLDATYVSDALWLDLDNDADLDLVYAVWGGASEIYLNDGQGRLRPANPAGDFGTVIDFASSVSASDADGDGDLDLYLTHWPINEAGGEPNHLYRNDTDAGNWMRIVLEGTESNRAAIGATVVVTARVGGRTVRQTRSVRARTSWRSSNSLAQHFGLGDAARVDEVRVRWPSGREEVVPGPLPANRTVRIVEGSGAVSAPGS